MCIHIQTEFVVRQSYLEQKRTWASSTQVQQLTAATLVPKADGTSRWGITRGVGSRAAGSQCKHERGVWELLCAVTVTRLCVWIGVVCVWVCERVFRFNHGVGLFVRDREFTVLWRPCMHFHYHAPLFMPQVRVPTCVCVCVCVCGVCVCVCSCSCSCVCVCVCCVCVCVTGTLWCPRATAPCAQPSKMHEVCELNFER